MGRQANYVEELSQPLYAFGYGLSYTEFEYSNLDINVEKDKVLINCTVLNSGNYDGEEVVQLYIRDNVSSVVTPAIQLKSFEKVYVKRGETERVSFALNFDDLALYNINMERVIEPGEFTVMIGAASNDIKLRGSFLIEN